MAKPNSWSAVQAYSCLIAMSLLLLGAGASAASAQGRNAGTLTCRANAGIELATNLRQRMRCHYVSRWGRTRSYSAVVARFESSPELGAGRFMRWTVHMKVRTAARRALFGRYVASDRIAAHGARAGELIGGGEGPHAIILRPSSSARGRSGVNLAPAVKDIVIGPWRRMRKDSV